MLDSITQSAALAQASVFLAATLGALSVTRGTGVTLCPIDAAQSMANIEGAGVLAWRDYLPVVRTAALALARCGELVLYRDGKQVDPDAVRGMFRLGLPCSE